MTGLETAANDQCGAPEKEGEEPRDSLEGEGGISASLEDAKALDRFFEVSVSDDGFAADLLKKEEPPPDVDAGLVREFLQARKIVYGLVEDEKIAECLASESRGPWRVAEGTAPTKGKGPEIRYCFDTDPMKIGMIKEDGAIDYRDRGDIPQVKKGDLLAEKIPAAIGSPGVTVYNKIVPASEPADIKLKCGRGVENSQDGEKAFAKVDGRPELSQRGELTVAPVLNIAGDVDFKTGHIDFDGHVEVGGAVLEGFRVKSTGLRAREIVRAEVEVLGNIFVAGGIIGSAVKSGGSIQAKYIHDSRVEASADLRIDKEIRDSEVEISGACVVEKGKILSSSVSARKGVQAQEIGSGSSKPCRLMVGVDPLLKREERGVKKAIEEAEREKNSRESLLVRLRETAETLNKEIGELAQFQDRAMVQQRKITEKVEALQKAGGAQLSEVEEAIRLLEMESRKNEEKLNAMLDEHERLASEIKDSQDELIQLEKERGQLVEALASLSSRSKEEAVLPVVKVPGCIFGGTQIRGPHASGVLKENYRGVLIREAQTTSPASEVRWKMSLSIYKP